MPQEEHPARSQANEAIPAEIEQFVLEHIDSIAQLEALLILRNKPDSWWPSGAVAERLYIAEKTSRADLEGLRRHGLLLGREDNVGWSYRYRPYTDELRKHVDRLVSCYSKQLVPISNLIHSKRRTRIQEFADAFTLNKRKK